MNRVNILYLFKPQSAKSPYLPELEDYCALLEIRNKTLDIS